MASDSNISTGGIIVGSGKKVMRTKDGYLVGGAGSYATLSMFFDWYADEDPDKPPLNSLKLEDFEGLIINPKGDVCVIDPQAYPMEIKAPFYALGSGTALAMGAMGAGASAIDAVKLCINLIASCGGKVQSVKL